LRRISRRIGGDEAAYRGGSAVDVTPGVTPALFVLALKDEGAPEYRQ
jgi:hypothetical protein